MTTEGPDAGAPTHAGDGPPAPPPPPTRPPVVDPDPHLPMLDRYHADVLRRLVETVIEERGEAGPAGGTGMVGRDSFTDAAGTRHPLHDLAEALAPLELAAWKGIISDHLAAIGPAVTAESLSDEEFRNRLRVRLTSRDHLAPSVAHLAPDWLPGVAQELVLHVPGLLHTVTEADLAPHGTYADLVAEALRHTQAMVEHVQGVTLPEDGPDRMTVVVGPEHFTATLATVLPQLLHHATGEADWGHGVFVAIPTRAKVLYRVVDSADALGSLVRMFHQAQQSFDTEPGPVSPHVYWVHGDSWRQATGPDASGASSILVREELEAELARAGWL